MITRMILQSWRRGIRRKALSVLTVFLAASLLSALLSVSLDIGDKMAREMKSYGANIIIEPAEQTVLPLLLGENETDAQEQSTFSEADLPKIVDIFWRNNIIGFAPVLSGHIVIEGKNTRVLGTYFDQSVPVADDADYRTGQKIISPYWQVTGAWPDDTRAEALVGIEMAERRGWHAGTQLMVNGEAVTVTGILTAGREEDDALAVPLKLAQQWLHLPGRVQQARVSALTVPENELSKKALMDPDSLDAEAYDTWYCTAYVSAIAHQLEEVMHGCIVRPVWQVAASEGVVINKIQWLLAVVTFAALVAAAMGIASLMTGALLERAKEIGLMKALGAHHWQILLLFYAEACISALGGALAGCVAGWGLAKVIGWQLFGQPLHFAWIVVPVVLVVSVLIAVVGTWFPARRIARLYPVEVLYDR